MGLETYEDSKGGGGSFFRYGEHADAVAILIEVKRDAPDSPGYKGKLSDAVYADLTVFDDLSTDPEVFRNQRLDRGYIYKQLNDKVGQALIRKLGKLPSKDGNQPAWRLNAVDEDVYKYVADYYQAREKALDEAADDLPDYLK